jgi:predicted nucleotidyltransferase
MRQASICASQFGIDAGGEEAALGCYIAPMTLEALIDTLRGAVARHADRIACAYLYGSAARRESRAASDIDLAVLFREMPPASLEGLGFDIAGEIERALGKPVDIVVLNRASPDLVHRVLRDGVLVHDGDRRMRIAFETRKRAEYFDVLPYLREYRRSVAGRRA